ncbi:hypothetical protein CU098_004300 [Rhizopus stolonifer]|uniref:BTB domain-containing protein n=1 Tax=Rhizopus stolonifer TaxID=4846 RepID=A0A367IZ00_RHIST|nr:hypothetical protein CU098_004300 [Rhizopus stolonifer]
MSSGAQSIADFTTEFKLTSGDIPPPLVGATTTVSGSRLYLFGGRLVSSRQLTNHLYILNLDNLIWTRHIAEPNSPTAPQPRYFHSADAYEKYLIIFGGMGHMNKMDALDDLFLFDLERMIWKYVERRPSLYSPRARYAHVSVLSGDLMVVMGGQDMSNQYINEINILCLKTFAWIAGSSSLKEDYGTYRSVAVFLKEADANLWGNHAETVCVYSNYNFADVTRDFQSFSPLSPSSGFKDHSKDMSGESLPPGLRFPSAHLLGQHLILAGIYLTPTVHTFQIWALNLVNLTWIKIDIGPTLAHGSWNKSVLYEKKQQYMVFGNKNRNLLEDYTHRQTNYDHITIVDLEAFGIYKFPLETSSPVAQELGLSMLNEPSMADIEIVTEDNHTIPINSSIIQSRWPQLTATLFKKNYTDSGFKRLLFPESYQVTLAFLQFIYTDHLLTSQQHQPQMLSRLLLLSELYHIPRLGELATHALHQCLTISTSSMIYEISALTGRISLQIRALRVMINAKKTIQKQQQLLNSSTLTSPKSPTILSSTSRISTEGDQTQFPLDTQHMITSKSSPDSLYTNKA